MTEKQGPKGLLAGLLTAGAASAAAYFLLVRPWHLRWGATDEEVGRVLPGDDLLPDPQIRATHAVTIHAPVSYVWPWLVQLGQGRGGFYSYDWLENLFGLDIHSADRIVPELQNLQVGDIIAMAPGDFGPPVASIEPERALVLGGEVEGENEGEEADPEGPPGMGAGFGASWLFFLEPVDENTTRLIERFRYQHPPGAFNALFALILEPVSFIMTQKMLRGIKQRAEAEAMQQAAR